MWPYFGGLSYKYLTASGIVCEGDAILFGACIDANTSGGQVTIYEGLDSSSGSIFAHIDGLVNRSQCLDLGPGVRFDRGIYVTLDANVDNVTLWFKRMKDV